MYRDEGMAFGQGFVGAMLAAKQLGLEQQKMAQQERYQNSLMALNEAQGEYYRQRQSTQVNPPSSDEILADYIQNPGRYTPEQVALIQKYKGSEKGLTGAIFDLAGAIGMTKGGLSQTPQADTSQTLSGISPSTNIGDPAYPKGSGYGPSQVVIPTQPLPSTLIGAIGQQAGLAGKEGGLNVKGMGVSNRGVDISYEAPANLSEEDKKNYKNWSALYDYSQWLKTNESSVSSAAGVENTIASLPLIGKYIEGSESTQSLTGGDTGSVFRTIMDAGFASMMKERGGTAVSPTELGLNQAWFPGKTDTDLTIQNKATALEYLSRQQLQRMSNVNTAGGFKSMPWDTGLLESKGAPKSNTSVFTSPSVPNGTQFEMPESLKGNNTARWSEKNKGWGFQRNGETWLHTQDGKETRLLKNQPKP
jgi:type II secretory pathway pseudopilin PulG